MPTRQYDCSICAKAGRPIKQTFGMFKGGVCELTEHEWFAQCLGCGALGIKVVDDTLIANDGV
jgi:hypothetical protein